jgi:hypothetical protein
MGILDSVTSATTAVSGAVNSVTTLIDTGPASALSNIGSSISGALGSVTGLLKSLGGSKLPLPNILSKYTTYNYIISLGVLTEKDINFPDTNYMAGKSFPLICKSANADPYNRVQTAYGKFDFFIDNIILQHQMGWDKNNNSNVTNIKFDLTEPFSMGMFLIACQTAAYQCGWKNYRDAPYVIKIEFRGNNPGSMVTVPNTTRYIPLKLTNTAMTVSEKGAKYACSGIAWNASAFSTRTANLSTDTSIKGATVQEVLQTGPKSLQSVLNARELELKKDGTVEEPDEYIILFPTDPASSATPAGAGDSAESTDSATTSTSTTSTGGSGSLEEKLGVSKSKINNTLVQPDGVCNALGKASMGYGLDKQGDPAFGSEQKVWDPTNKVWIRANAKSAITEGEFRFAQDSDIPNAINQVLLKSDYPTQALDVAQVNAEGLRQWWHIDTQIYTKGGSENLNTGIKARLIVYRVLPYEVSVASTNPPNTAPPGVDNLKKQSVKEYNYIFTGKNTEVLRFDIKFNAAFQSSLASDNFKRGQGVQTAETDSTSTSEKDTDIELPKGNLPSDKLGVIPTTSNRKKNISSTDGQGGGGEENEVTRAARIFHDAITRGNDMLSLNMDIWGDPYYIAQSGQGNYTSKATSFKNLNSDGTVNYQNGEVYVTVNFRTPIDINQATGLYKFSNNSAPVVAFSGLYRVTNVTSTFLGGSFKQTLKGQRMPQQENPNVGTKEQTYSISNKKPSPPDPNE